MNTQRVILWDWNGTLLDDVQFAIRVRNSVFPRFGLPVIESVAAYHEQFTFPVKVYYQRAGVTEENFPAVANAWMDEYVKHCQTVPLFQDAVFALNAFTRNNFSQIILSASELAILRRQLEYTGIAERFDAVLGLSHIYATDKTDIAGVWLEENHIDPANCVLLGDTEHDAMVADALHMACVLVARGHMSRQHLLQTGYPVCADLQEAVQLILHER